MTVYLSDEERTLITQNLADIDWVMVTHGATWDQAYQLVKWVKSDRGYVKDPHELIIEAQERANAEVK